MKYDFSGWATKNNITCSDGRVIIKDAFKDNDGKKVPLVWNHMHNEPFNVLGHAILENRDEGVYAYCTFNDTEAGKNAKMLVEHGDVSALSIYANHLKQLGANVVHGAIRELSLVLAGANPEAFIDSILAHGEESSDEAIIYTGDTIELYHADDTTPEDKKDAPAPEDKKDAPAPEDKKANPAAGNTVEEIYNTLTEKQKTVVLAMVGQALAESDMPDDNNESKGGNDTMKHNVFDKDDKDDKDNKNVLQHSDVEAIFSDFKRGGSLRDCVLQHGITNIDYLFPEAKTTTMTPQFISRDTGWVAKVMGSLHHTPFSRIKSLFANITEDDARAKGYIKGNLKKEEVISLLKRTTVPQTVYKKQKFDRDDVVDIVDFDVVAWIKAEMRVMLDEEIARATLVGDGRLASSEDKILEANIRPIWKDEDLYTIKHNIVVASNATDNDKAKAFIRGAIKSRKGYKGAGEPTLYTNEDVLTDCLLLEDSTGRLIYDSVQKLALILRVKEIVTVPVMEGLSRESGGTTYDLKGIIVNLVDYNLGADKGGAVNMFDDFDIDYNQQKYLIETRCSGALVTPYSAIALEMSVAA